MKEFLVLFLQIRVDISVNSSKIWRGRSCVYICVNFFNFVSTFNLSELFGRSIFVMTKIPRHIAIIMDGNGRWARSRGLPRNAGHLAGVNALRKIITHCAEIGVQYLTIYCFSTENWQRESKEIEGLMEIFRNFLTDTLSDESAPTSKLKIRTIGQIERLPTDLRISLENLERDTARNTGLCLVAALSYGSRQDMIAAVKKIARLSCIGEVNEEAISEQLFASCLSTSGIPDPDLLIRTSGEFRISNFLLWELAYSEFVVVDEYWPDFTPELLDRSIEKFSKRERRFGLTSEQLVR